jgi:thiol-disulfide isomerase/thioredoxin
MLALLLPLLAVPSAFAAMPVQPALQVTTLAGKPWNLAAQRGHWVIVNFWATWCVPCIREMPDISAFVDKHAKVRAIGLAYDDSPAQQIRAFLKKHPVAYPVAQVPLDHPPKDFDVPQGLPTTWLIAPDGRVAKRFIGPIDAATLGRAIQTGH